MVQGEQALQHFRIRQRHRPAIGRKDCRVQLPMRLRQPARPGTLQIRGQWRQIDAVFDFLKLYHAFAAQLEIDHGPTIRSTD